MEVEAPLKILTLNAAQLKFPLGMGDRDTRALLLANILGKEKETYDIICLQELFRKKSQDILIRWLHKRYPYYIVDRSRGKYLVGVNSGLAIFSKFPILRKIQHRFTVSGGVENFAKKSIWGFEINFKGTTVYVFNTHLQTGLSKTPCICKLFDRHRKSSTELKAQQIKEIRETVIDFVGEADNIVVAGDFNIEAGSNLHSTLYEELNVVRLLDMFNPGESDFQTTIIDADKRIDYVWFDGVGDSVIVDSFRMNPEITDHYGVVAELYLTRVARLI